MEALQVSILIIGDEILDGLIADANGPYISKFLSLFGSQVIEKVEVRDDKNLIKEALEFLLSFSQGVFVCGGLGPTEDDVTREAISEYLGVDPVFREDIWADIKEKLLRRGREPLSSHRKMAYVPRKAVVFLNPVGLAPAFVCEYEGKFIAVFPGVPRELKALFPKVCSFLFMRGGGKMIKVFKTVGLKESEVNERIREVLAGINVKWGTLIKDGEIWINVKAEKDALELVSKRLKSAFGLFIYGEDEDTLEALIGRLLKERGMSLSVAESCTGGLLANLITNVSGSSDYFKGGVVSYLEETKHKVLGVKWEDIKRYTVYSHEVARQMAEGVRRLMGSSVSISTTGVAGPTGGTEDNPVGTVYIGIATPEFVKSFRFNFNYDRLGNKMAFAKMALDILRRYLLADETVCGR